VTQGVYAVPSNIDKIEIKTQQGIEYSNKGNSDQAIRCFYHALELVSTTPPLITLSRLGNELLKTKQFEEAQDVFNMLSDYYPKRSAGLIGRARAAQSLEQWETALAFWDECLQRFSGQDQPGWHKHRADVLVQLESFEEAKNIYTRLDQTFGEQPWGCQGLAIIAAKQKQWKDAAFYWTQCFERYPKHVQPWWHNQKKRALLAAGDMQDAYEQEKAKHSSDIAETYFSILENKVEHSLRLNYDSILVITYGRSGSTLLQGILNTINNVVIRGENGNIFYDFFKIYKKLGELKQNHQSAILPKDPWFGIGSIDENGLLDHFKETARTLLLAEQANEAQAVYGFKEIRYAESVGEQLPEYLDFLSSIFPNPAFVFNTRKLDDVLRSAWWKESNLEVARQTLMNAENRFNEYVSSHTNCFQITYEDIVNQSGKLQAMFEFLGAPYSKEQIEIILATPHSYEPSQKNIQKLFDKF
jgi:tetratricopeptide (TPR) repeat protein